MGQDASADMLQARLIVNHHIAVIAVVLVHLGSEHAVDVAIAALALGSAHDEHIEIIFFDQSRGKLHFGIVRLGHARRNGAVLHHFSARHLFTNIAQRGFNLHAQHFVQIGICIRIHHQDGGFLLAAKQVNQHAAGGRLADAALSGNCNGVCHFLLLFRSRGEVNSILHLNAIIIISQKLLCCKLCIY